MKSKTQFFLVLTIFALILAGCNETPTIVPPTSTYIPITPPLFTKTLAAPTATRTPTIENTATFTTTLMATQRMPTETPIQTPEITVSPKLIRKKFLELYETNGNCKLPCWWGIVPGNTTLEEVKLEFAPYGELFNFEEDSDRIILNYEGLNDSIDYLISTLIYFDERGIVTLISLDQEAVMWNGFDPTYLLTKIGKPDQVLISDTQITMLYKDQQIYAVYDVVENKNTNQICLFGFDTLELGAYKVDSSYSSANNYSDDKNIQAFYDAFKIRKGSKNCFYIQ
jgi:hypothetical protein